MKKTRITAIIMAILLFANAACASNILSAGIKGKCLEVNWDVDCSGTAVLTVYKNNWPVEVRTVNCDDGKAVVCLSNPNGTYSVRLRTDSQCLSAGVTIAGNTQAPEITKRPEATLRPEVTATPAPAPEFTYTPAPTQAATPVPTPVITASPIVTAGTANAVLAQQVVAQVNAERAKYGLSALRTDSELNRAAAVRAGEIVKKFSHTRPDGSHWSTVSNSAFGENIAKGQKTADKVMAAWLTSEGHRANILRQSFGSIGVCAYIYNGVTYWVQLFGR